MIRISNVPFRWHANFNKSMTSAEFELKSLYWNIRVGMVFSIRHKHQHIAINVVINERLKINNGRDDAHASWHSFGRRLYRYYTHIMHNIIEREYWLGSRPTLYFILCRTVLELDKEKKLKMRYKIQQKNVHTRRHLIFNWLGVIFKKERRSGLKYVFTKIIFFFKSYSSPLPTIRYVPHDQVW